MNRPYLITGCSGGGKSTLIELLAKRGVNVVREPGLRVIQSGGPTPWNDRKGFIEAATALAQSDLEQAASLNRLTFFDRGLFDALSGQVEARKLALSDLMPEPFPYSPPVFFAPPWPEIYEQTADRRHSFDFAQKEAIRLKRDLLDLGVPHVDLPKVSVEDRADQVLAMIS